MSPLPCLIALSFMGFAWSARTQSYEAEGELDYQVLPRDGQKVPITSFRFTVSVVDCKWSIHTVLMNSTSNSLNDYFDSFDGTNVYSIMSRLENSRPKTSVGMIERTSIPGDNSWWAGPIWLAYCSSCYLNGATNRQIKPFWHIGKDPEKRAGQFTLPAEWTLDPGPPNAPTEVLYFSGSGPAALAVAQFHALRMTNFNSLSLPMEFIFERCPGNADAYRTNARFHGVLTRLSPEASGYFDRPLLKASTTVEDRRFASAAQPVPAIVYQQSNGWRDLSDPELDRIYRSHLRQTKMKLNVPRTPEAREKRRWSVMFLILLAVLVPVCVFIQKPRKKL